MARKNDQKQYSSQAKQAIATVMPADLLTKLAMTMRIEERIIDPAMTTDIPRVESPSSPKRTMTASIAGKVIYFSAMRRV